MFSYKPAWTPSWLRDLSSRHCLVITALFQKQRLAPWPVWFVLGRTDCSVVKCDLCNGERK